MARDGVPVTGLAWINQHWRWVIEAYILIPLSLIGLFTIMYELIGLTYQEDSGRLSASIWWFLFFLVLACTLCLLVTHWHVRLTTFLSDQLHNLGAADQVPRWLICNTCMNLSNCVSKIVKTEHVAWIGMAAISIVALLRLVHSLRDPSGLSEGMTTLMIVTCMVVAMEGEPKRYHAYWCLGTAAVCIVCLFIPKQLKKKTDDPQDPIKLLQARIDKQQEQIDLLLLRRPCNCPQNFFDNPNTSQYRLEFNRGLAIGGASSSEIQEEVVSSDCGHCDRVRRPDIENQTGPNPEGPSSDGAPIPSRLESESRQQEPNATTSAGENEGGGENEIRQVFGTQPSSILYQADINDTLNNMQQRGIIRLQSPSVNQRRSTKKQYPAFKQGRFCKYKSTSGGVNEGSAESESEIKEEVLREQGSGSTQPAPPRSDLIVQVDTSDASSSDTEVVYEEEDPKSSVSQTENQSNSRPIPQSSQSVDLESDKQQPTGSTSGLSNDGVVEMCEIKVVSLEEASGSNLVRSTGGEDDTSDARSSETEVAYKGEKPKSSVPQTENKSNFSANKQQQQQPFAQVDLALGQEIENQIVPDPKGPTSDIEPIPSRLESESCEQPIASASNEGGGGEASDVREVLTGDGSSSRQQDESKSSNYWRLIKYKSHPGLSSLTFRIPRS